MQLKKISVINYKNLASKAFEFDTKFNAFIGANGVGKTNVLDAIYHLSFTKGYINTLTTQNIRHHTDFLVLEGTYQRNEREEILLLSAKRNQKKVLKRNGKSYSKLTEHIGQFPLVMISPSDQDLIYEGSLSRRRFIDQILSQTDALYLESLLIYNKVISQRNALLKQFSSSGFFDAPSLEIYDVLLEKHGKLIFEKRLAFFEQFNPIVQKRYSQISLDAEQIELTYQSQVKEGDYSTLLHANLPKDRVLQYTSFGVHKDDMIFKLNGHTIKKFGSQGQQKSFLIALKLAQFDFLVEQMPVAPLVLLDDIFDKLDQSRILALVSLLNTSSFGQVFITDTHKERCEDILLQNECSFKLFELTI